MFLHVDEEEERKFCETINDINNMHDPLAKWPHSNIKDLPHKHAEYFFWKDIQSLIDVRTQGASYIPSRHNLIWAVYVASQSEHRSSHATILIDLACVSWRKIKPYIFLMLLTCVYLIMYQLVISLDGP